jgi:hypothetical protein
MNNEELDRILKAAKTPSRPEEYWTGFPQRVASRLHWKPASAVERRTSWYPRLAWGFATVAACLLAGFFVGHWRGATEAKANGLLQNEKVIKETLAMFPNRVRAIVQDEHGLSLVLSEKDDVPLSSPLWVKVCDGNQCLALVTFSGQEVQLAGRKVTVLSDAQGGVLLVGSDFVWSSKEKIYANNQLKIEAKNLGSMAM